MGSAFNATPPVGTAITDDCSIRVHGVSPSYVSAALLPHLIDDYP